MDSLAIELDGVTKSFRLWDDRPNGIKKFAIQLLHRRVDPPSRISVLDGLSFTVPKGEFVGVMGRNGVGKSTLLKIMCGIYRPSAGTVQVRGRIAPLIELGTGFQPELSGRENIFLNSSALGFGRREVNRHFDEILAFSELGAHIERPIRHYSSGMLLRLAFSVVTHMPCDTLLADEVLAVGDIGFQAKCLNRIREMHGQGRTIVLVTHDPVAVAEHCSRCVLIENGKVRFNGPSRQGAQLYRDLFSVDGAS